MTQRTHVDAVSPARRMLPLLAGCLAAKAIAHEYLRFLLRLGNELTLIEFARPSQPTRWVEELQASAEMQLGEKMASRWIGINYHLPIAGGPEPTKGAAGIDPTVRLVGVQHRFGTKTGSH